MTSPNIELVRSLYAAWQRGDYSSVEWADPAIEVEFADGPSPGRVAGVGGMAKGWRDFVSAWDEYRQRLETCRELDGDRVLVLSRFTGRGKRSGVELEQPGAVVFHFRADKVSKIVRYWERERAFADLGLPEGGSAGSLEIAREVLDALGRRDAARLIELSDPEVEWQSFFAFGEGGAYRGHDGTRRYMRDLEDAFEIGLAEVDDALGIGEVAVLVGRLRYRGKGSGVESASPAGWMMKFREGKLILFRAFREPEQVLGAIGPPA
jgi:ketosteroid isomerase-like protein